MQNISVGVENIELLGQSRFPLISRPIRKFGMPVLVCILWFVISPFLFSQSLITLAEGVRAILLGYFVLSFLYNKKPFPRFGLIGWMLVIGIPMDLLSETAPVSFHPMEWIRYIRYIFFRTPFGLVILICLYLDSRSRLINFLKVLVLAITITISLVGFYQLYTGNLIADYSSIAEWGILSSHAGGRLVGLIYGCANEAAGIILISLGLLIGAMITKLNIISLLLFGTNLVALIFTFTRGAYVAFTVMALTAMVIIVKTKRKKVIKLMLGLVAFTVVPFLIFETTAIQHLFKTGDIHRFLSHANVTSRLLIYEEAISLIPKMVVGRGLTCDLSQFFFHKRGLYITPHNCVFDWVIRFGSVAAIFFIILIALQLIRMIKYSFISASRGFTDEFGIGLIFAYVGVLGNALFTGDRYYFIPLLYILCSAYLKFAPKVKESNKEVRRS